MTLLLAVILLSTFHPSGAAAEPQEVGATPGGHNTGGLGWSPSYTAQVGRFLDSAVGAAQP